MSRDDRATGDVRRFPHEFHLYLIAKDLILLFFLRKFVRFLFLNDLKPVDLPDLDDVVVASRNNDVSLV